MKTIDELVGEVAKNLGAGKSSLKQAPKSAEIFNKKDLKVETVKLKSDISVQEKSYSEKISLDIAKEIAKAVEIASGRIGVKTVVSICDEGANLILLHAMDDSYIASIKASQDKAYTAVALKMPTHAALKESRGGSLDGLTNGNGILLLGGGYPLVRDNKICGGVGVSGGTKEQDMLLAAVASAYFEARFKGGPKI